MELNVSKPLQQGTWVKYGEFSVFILVLYEKLPVFCFRCGMVGHGEAHCPILSNCPHSGLHVPSRAPPELVREDAGMQVDDTVDGLEGIADEIPSTHPSESGSEFCPWLKPRSRRSSTRSRGFGRGGGQARLPAAMVPETLTLVSLLGMIIERVTLVLLIPLLMST